MLERMTSDADAHSVDSFAATGTQSASSKTQGTAGSLNTRHPGHINSTQKCTLPIENHFKKVALTVKNVSSGNGGHKVHVH